MKKIIACCALLFGLSLASFAQNKNNITRETKVFSIKGKDTLRIDAYFDNATVVKPEGRPTMVYIHGGGFTMGSRKNAAQEIFCRYLAERGWLAVSVDYRLAGISKNADGSIRNSYKVDGTLSAIRIACNDVVDAVDFMLKQSSWKANPAQVCLGGGSAGAFTSLQLVYDACNGETYTKRLPANFKFAGAISQAGAVSSMADTLVWKTKPCPIMFFHGDQDIVVPLEKGKLDCNLFGTLYLTRQMQQMGVSYWKWIEHGADHVMAMKPLTTYLEEQYRFLNDYALGGLQGNITTDVTDKEPAGMKDVNMMIKYVPMYILGYDKYLDEIDWGNMSKPDNIVF